MICLKGFIVMMSSTYIFQFTGNLNHMIGSDSTHGILDSLGLLLSLDTTVHKLNKLMDLTPLKGRREEGRKRGRRERESYNTRETHCNVWPTFFACGGPWSNLSCS